MVTRQVKDSTMDALMMMAASDVSQPNCSLYVNVNIGTGEVVAIKTAAKRDRQYGRRVQRQEAGREQALGHSSKRSRSACCAAAAGHVRASPPECQVLEHQQHALVEQVVQDDNLETVLSKQRSRKGIRKQPEVHSEAGAAEQRHLLRAALWVVPGEGEESQQASVRH